MKEFSLTQKLSAEFFGTFFLVLGCCGSAVLAAAFPRVGIGLLGKVNYSVRPVVTGLASLPVAVFVAIAQKYRLIVTIGALMLL